MLENVKSVFNTKNLLLFLLLIAAVIFVLFKFSSREVRVQELWLNSQGKKIYGTMYLPPAKRFKYPLIIMSHGFNGDSRYPRIVSNAKYFAKSGYAVYAFDFAGGGPGSLSDGKGVDMSVLTEARNLSDVLTQVEQLDYIDKKNIILFGYSQGGYISAYVAASRPEEIKGLVLYYPAFNISSPEWESTMNKHIMSTKDLFDKKIIGKKYFKDANSVDIYKHIKNYKKDVLILHGRRDVIVDLKYSQKAAEAYDKNKVKLVIYDYDGHGLGDPAYAEAKIEAYNFCQKLVHSPFLTKFIK